MLLGANAVRYLNGMRMGTGNFILGSVALACGVGGIFGLTLPLLPILLVLIGGSLLIGLAVRAEPVRPARPARMPQEARDAARQNPSHGRDR